MNIYDFIKEYDDLSKKRKVEYAKKVFDYIVDQINEGEDYAFRTDILPVLVALEGEDYFGTEGFSA